MSQIRRLMKQGGSTVLSIPPYMLAELELVAGDEVELFYYSSGVITLSKQSDRLDKPKIAELVLPP